MTEPEPKSATDSEMLTWLVSVRDLRESHRRPAGFVYSCVEDFLLRQGTFFTPRILPASVRPMRARECFENAFRVAVRTKAYHYVEGIAFSMMPVNHAWLIDQEGNVIDPTWCDERMGTSYCGVELDLAEVKLSRRGGSNTLLEDWKRDWPALQGLDVVAKDMWYKR